MFTIQVTKPVSSDPRSFDRKSTVALLFERERGDLIIRQNTTEPRIMPTDFFKTVGL